MSPPGFFIIPEDSKSRCGCFRGQGHNLLDQNEKFQITIGDKSSTAGNGGNLVNALTTPLGIYRTFTLEMLTPLGAVLTIERTTPACIDQIMDLG